MNKQIKKIEWFALMNNGALFKKGYVKTIKGARNAKARADMAYGANLAGSAIVYYTDGSCEKTSLF